MYDILCCLICVFSVYGIYSALREVKLFLFRRQIRKGGCDGCASCQGCPSENPQGKSEDT